MEPFGYPVVHRSMEDRAGVEVEDVERWLCSLAPRAELVARMALHLRFHELRGDKRYFARIASLIKELDLKAEDLGVVREDAQKVAAYLGDADPGKSPNETDECAEADTRSS